MTCKGKVGGTPNGVHTFRKADHWPALLMAFSAAWRLARERKRRFDPGVAFDSDFRDPAIGPMPKAAFKM